MLIEFPPRPAPAPVVELRPNPNTTLADRRAIAAALAQQAVADADGDAEGEEAANDTVMELATLLGQRVGMQTAMEEVGDVRRVLAAWATRREMEFGREGAGRAVSRTESES